MQPNHNCLFKKSHRATLRFFGLLGMASFVAAIFPGVARAQALSGNSLTLTDTGMPVINFVKHSPSVQWQIGAEEQDCQIICTSAGTQPFAIRYGAPSNSFSMANTGYIGFGTSSPLTPLHAISSSTVPALRLEAASIPMNQAWDMKGDFGEFNITDVTNGNTAFFRAATGTPVNTLVLQNDGHVGIGTSSPSQSLEIATPVGPTLRLTATGAPGISWDMASSLQDLRITQSGVATPIIVDESAADNALVLKTAYGGSVGFGTTTPRATLHAVSSTPFPALRLETSNPAPQAWDLAGSSNAFEILDHTNSDAIPLTVQTQAPTNSLVVASSGRVGLGKSNPASQLHAVAHAIIGGESVARFDVSDDAVGRLEINNATTTSGLFIPRIQGRSNSSNAALIAEGSITSDTGTNPVIVYNANLLTGGAVATRPLVVYRNNNTAKVTIAANGNVTATAFINASSRDLKDRIVDLDPNKASTALRQLTPVEFVYKDDATAEPRVGFIAEDVPDLVAEPDRKSVPVMDVVALVTRVVKDQQQTIEELKQVNLRQQQDLKAATEQLAATNERLARLERLLGGN